MTIILKKLLRFFVLLVMTVKVLAVYELPTLTGELNDINKFKSSYLKSKKIPTTALFNAVVACYPAKSFFDLNIKVKIGSKAYQTKAETSQDGFYGGIVAEMPLFSTNENERLRNQEFKRRQDISKLVATFAQYVVKKNLAIRKIALFQSLEKREQLRVKSGFVVVANQVSYLEKLANEHEKKITAVVDIESARLQLVAHCANSKTAPVLAILNKIITQ